LNRDVGCRSHRRELLEGDVVTQAMIKEGTGDDLVEVPLRILSGIVSSTARTATTSRSIFDYFLSSEKFYSLALV
jgi:hypothetical protein